MNATSVPLRAPPRLRARSPTRSSPGSSGTYTSRPAAPTGLEREERERPYLAVDFEFRSLLVLIAVENISTKLATNVTLKSIPLPESTRGDRLGRLERVFDGSFVIPQVAPGRMSWHVDIASTLLESNILPRRFEVTARYCDPLARSVAWFGLRSARPEPRWYEDTFILDLDQYGYAATDQDYENKNWNIAQRNERRLECIAAASERIVAELQTRDGSEMGSRARRGTIR